MEARTEWERVSRGVRAWAWALLEGFASLNIAGYDPKLAQLREEMAEAGYDARMLARDWEVVIGDLSDALDVVARDLPS